MKNARVISMSAALVAGLIGLIPTLGIVFSSGDTKIAFIGPALIATQVLIVITTLFALASSGVNMAINPGGIRKSLTSLGALVAIFLVAFLISDGSDFALYNDVDENTTKWVSVGLNAFYITFILGVGAILFSVFYRARQ